MSNVARPSKKTLKSEVLTSIGNNPPENIADRNAAISALAYQYYLERGGEHGHDMEDWIRAENAVKSQIKKSGK